MFDGTYSPLNILLLLVSTPSLYLLLYGFNALMTRNDKMWKLILRYNIKVLEYESGAYRMVF